jgi:hypothetical protein
MSDASAPLRNVILAVLAVVDFDQNWPIFRRGIDWIPLHLPASRREIESRLRGGGNAAS